MFGGVSQRLQTTFITPSMVFVVVGFLVASDQVGFVDIDLQSGVIGTMAELTLVLVLYTDAARIGLQPLSRDFHLPARLLGIGFPLTIVAGAIVARVLFPEFSVWEAALLGVLLAPTDAALGQIVVSSPLVPVRIRQALNVESGLNDGLAVPALLIALSFVGETHAAVTAPSWVAPVLRQIVLAPIVGVAIAYVGGHLVDYAARSKWMSHVFQELATVAIALLAFGAAESLQGSGFIAAFCAGLTIGNAHGVLRARLYDFAEAEGQLLALITFMAVGAILVGPTTTSLGSAGWLYAILSLTIVRMLPVALSLAGSGVTARTGLFLGWFGPRGLASIVFAVLVVERKVFPHANEIFAITIGTVVLSVFAHGLTALPGAHWYGGVAEKLGADRSCAELQHVHDHPLRIPHRT